MLQHIDGHSRSNPYSITISGEPGGDSDARAHSRAKRGALIDALHIIVSHLSDDDAAEDGAPITPNDAAILAARVKNCGVDEAAFLKFAGADSFADIASSKLVMLAEWLDKKPAAPVDQTKELRGKLWEALAPVRGPEASWVAATAWMRGKKILPGNVKVSDLTESDLLDVIAKTQIELNL